MDTSRAGDGGLKDPLWYKDAVIYELHVRSFFDSNGDGIGDFPGLIQKLDYLVDLGVTAIWLLPFYPSPLKDGGYDIQDYMSIDPCYGTMRDWRNFLREAHARGLRVITELVVNHTSDQHEWFQRSRRAAPGSRWRNFYVWTNDSQKYKRARIIFKDFELSNWTWDPAANAYYWHRFYSHQPDLNFDNPEVHRAIFRVLDFWLEQGVDGFRLDAVPYLYEREDTSCENLPETHEFLRELRRRVDARYGGDRLLLAEANAWPDDAVPYFGQGAGDECHMAFHFPLMPRLFMGVRMEDRVPIIDILEQTPALPSAGQWALFLRNHDELTLEMVTDEERDYMYRVYAQDTKARLNLGIRRRLAPLLGNDRKKIELLNLLLLSMPGTPVLYYGDEIGMGDNIYLGDRFGVRTPMHWNSDKNAGFSRASPQALTVPVVVAAEYHYESVNVETQDTNSNSLLWWTRRLLNLRKQWKAFGRGTLEFVPADNRKVLAFIRRYENECVLIVANLSRLPQPVELNLSQFDGRRPVELFGRTEFPMVTASPYVMTLSPHSAFWLSLQTKPEKEALQSVELRVETDWREFLSPRRFPEFAQAMRPYLEKQPWYLGQGRSVESIRLEDVVELPSGCLVLLLFEYLHAESEHYLLTLSEASGPAADELRKNHPELVIVNLISPSGSGILYDGLGSDKLVDEVLNSVLKRRPIKGRTGVCRAWHATPNGFVPDKSGNIKRLLFNRSNTSLALQEGVFFKLIRKLEVGINPSVEIERHLKAKGFPNVPPLVGTLEYESKLGGVMSLAVLSRVVPDSTNAWFFTSEALDRYFDRAQTLVLDEHPTLRFSSSLVKATGLAIPPSVPEVVGAFPEFARLLGRRAGEMHRALADSTQPEFVPEPFSPFYLRSLYQSIRNRVRDALEMIRLRADTMMPETRTLAARLVERKAEVFARIQNLYRAMPYGVRIRCHGNFHLGEVLYSGKDFFIIDFEGDASRPISERRIKRPPSYDLARMISSFHCSARHKLEDRIIAGSLPRDKGMQMLPWVGVWAYWVSVGFLQGYVEAIGTDTVLTQSSPDRELVLNNLLVDRYAREIIESGRSAPGLSGGPLESWVRTLDFLTA